MQDAPLIDDHISTFRLTREITAFDPCVTTKRLVFVRKTSVAIPPNGLLFLKPEICELSEESTAEILSLIVNSIELHRLNILEIYLFSGAYLLRRQFFQRNYRLLHQYALLSGTTSSWCNMLDAESPRRLQLERTRAVLGGLVASRHIQTPLSLFNLWNDNSDSIHRVTTDCYALLTRMHGVQCVLLNGFYPYQLQRYASPAGRVVCLLFNTATEFRALKKDFQGVADPKNSAPNSIRYFLYKNCRRLGVPILNTSFNGIHLSDTREDGLREAMLVRDLYRSGFP